MSDDRPAARDGRTRHLAGVVCLAVTVCGWALNWSSIKVLLQVWPPLFSRGLAGVAAAAALMALARVRGERLAVPAHAIPRLAMASFTNVFTWMGFGSIAMRWVSVGEGTLLVYTVPIWATLFAWPFRGTRPTWRGTAALALGLSGLFTLLGSSGFAFSGVQGIGAALLLAASMLFALGTVLNGTPLPMPPLAATGWQVGLGCLPMVVLGLAFEHPDVGGLTRAGFLSLAYMAAFPMGVCYLTWFAALRRLSPFVASTSMLLVPIVGTASAALLLGEPVGSRELLAVLLTLSGVALALRRA